MTAGWTAANTAMTGAWTAGSSDTTGAWIAGRIGARIGPKINAEDKTGVGAEINAGTAASCPTHQWRARTG